jgi:indoleamine 2,3-dioxygenase
VRRAIEWLPLLDPAALHDGPELERAMLLLSFLGHAYVWGGPRPAARIPDVLAVPWAEVAARLGRPPILSYASYALGNWRRLERDGPFELSNLAVLQNFTGGADEDWFVLVHVAIEAAAASALGALLPVRAAVASGDTVKLESQLECITDSLERMAALLARMPEWCDPVVHRRRVLPWLQGWDHPALGGVVYEGVARLEGHPQRLRGPSGRDCGIVPALEGTLVEDASLGSCVAAHREVAPSLARAFRACLAELERFRWLRRVPLAGD